MLHNQKTDSSYNFDYDRRENQAVITSKPTGQETCLDIFLIYDFVKAHGDILLAIGIKTGNSN